MDACAVHSSLWEILEQITENLKSKRLADVFRFISFYPSETYGPHKHLRIEINYVKKGYCILHLDNESVTFKEGEIMVITSDVNHLFEAGSEGTTLMQLEFLPEIFSNFNLNSRVGKDASVPTSVFLFSAYNLDLNLASHWRLARIAKPYLEQSGNGVILLMTSNHAFCSIPGCFPYNVTKTAITGLVRSLTIEWGPKIRTVGVAPGFIDTAGNDTWFNSFPDAMAERQRTINLHPVKKIGTVEEVGALCVYLASPMAGFISGTTILMDGGRSALMQDS